MRKKAGIAICILVLCFALCNNACCYTYDGAVTCRTFTGGEDTDWVFTPVDVSDIFQPFGEVSLVANISNIAKPHKWGFKATDPKGKSSEFLEEEWHNPDSEVWSYSYFASTIYSSLSVLGIYQIKIFLDIGNGFELVEEMSFEMQANEPYTYNGAVTCRTFTGGEDTNWIFTPVDASNIFQPLGKVSLVASISNITKPHKWGFKITDPKEKSWDFFETVWHDTDGEVWSYSYFASTIYSNLSSLGTYQIKIFLDTENGFELVEERNFEVREPSKCFLTATPSIITKGETSTLIIKTERDVTSVTLKPYIKIVGGSLTSKGGRLIVKPDSTITYTVKVNGPSGSYSCAATVNVE